MASDNPGGIALSVNGETVHVPTGSTIADLLKTLSLSAALVAVEHNLRVVPRAEHVTRRLNHGDKLEIVTFVDGAIDRREFVAIDDTIDSPCLPAFTFTLRQVLDR